jgi:hypothetical protein
MFTARRTLSGSLAELDLEATRWRAGPLARLARWYAVSHSHVAIQAGSQSLQAKERGDRNEKEGELHDVWVVLRWNRPAICVDGLLRSGMGLHKEQKSESQ